MATSGEAQEVMATHVERERAERCKRREMEMAARREEEARRVKSERRPLRIRLAMGAVAAERLQRPRWWAEEQRRQQAVMARQRREAAARERAERRMAEVMARREAAVLAQAKKAALDEVARIEAATRAQQEARRKDRMQREMEALMSDIESIGEAGQRGGVEAEGTSGSMPPVGQTDAQARVSATSGVAVAKKRRKHGQSRSGSCQRVGHHQRVTINKRTQVRHRKGSNRGQ